MRDLSVREDALLPKRKLTQHGDIRELKLNPLPDLIDVFFDREERARAVNHEGTPNSAQISPAVREGWDQLDLKT